MSITKRIDGDVEIVEITGGDLEAFKSNLTTAIHGETAAGCCVKCKDAFSSENVFTSAGWRETGLSGFCERCWDAMFAEEDDDE